MIDKYLDIAWEQKNTVEHEDDTNYSLSTWNGPQRLGK